MKDNEKQKERESILAEVDNLIDEDVKAADTAEAEISNAATVPSKFKDYKTLLKAYTDLEAEFTRRSQRLKELEQENKAQCVSDGNADSPSPMGEQQILEAALSSELVRDAVIREYLESVYKSKTIPLLLKGSGVSAPRIAPKSVSEAGKLAQEFLNN